VRSTDLSEAKIFVVVSKIPQGEIKAQKQFSLLYGTFPVSEFAAQALTGRAIGGLHFDSSPTKFGEK